MSVVRGCAGGISPWRFWTCKWERLDRVDNLHLSNDTVIIFTSDHGYGIGNGPLGRGSAEIG